MRCGALSPKLVGLTIAQGPSARTISTDPDWWRQAAAYQIYPRSFTDANGNGLGDIAGITSRVPYLASLHIDAVWLSPFYPSPLADGGYDVADYRDVDDRLGTLADFDALVDALHASGIRIITDIVPNHSSHLHPWFQEALAAAPGSAARERYIFRDGAGPDGALPPSGWGSNFGGPAWTRVPDGQWCLHLFAKEQPDFNWDNPQIQEDFLTTLRFWSDRGVDGFRVDVANSLIKDLSEPFRPSIDKVLGGDLPIDGSDPLYDRDDVHAVFERWREVLNEYDPPRSAVAEAWVPRERRLLYARPTELGQAFNFDLLLVGWHPHEFHDVITSNLNDAAATGASSTWVLSNHDVVRHATRYGLPSGADHNAWLLGADAAFLEDRDVGLRRSRAATLLMLALPGSAYLYQGEELGLSEASELDDHVLQDPTWERTGHQEKGRDGCRVPLPWERGGESFGFGPGGSHLPQPDWFGDLSVEAQDGAYGSTLELYRAALRARAQLQGNKGLDWQVRETEGVLHFIRSGGWHCVTNFSQEAVDLPAGVVVVCSGPLQKGLLPTTTTAWMLQ